MTEGFRISGDDRPDIAIGDRFQSRARPAMVATVTGVFDSYRGWYATVARSTSRRTQSILARRLLSRAYTRLSRGTS